MVGTTSYELMLKGHHLVADCPLGLILSVCHGELLDLLRDLLDRLFAGQAAVGAAVGEIYDEPYRHPDEEPDPGAGGQEAHEEEAREGGEDG